MRITTQPIDSFAALIGHFCEQKRGQWNRWFYRGHTRSTHRLIPRVGRSEFQGANESRLFSSWSRHAASLLLEHGPQDDWDRLAIAQHHGLATRLLDWSFNPLVATFFAVVGGSGALDETEDCIVWAHYSEIPRLDQVPGKKKGSPLDIEGVWRLTPSPLVPRIVRQGGMFTLHGPPSLALDEMHDDSGQLVQFVINKREKKDIANMISHFGVNTLGLFPDLDGVSRHLNWTFQNLPYTPTSELPVREK